MKKLIWLLPLGAIAFYLYQRSRINFRITGFKLKPKPVITIQILNPAQVAALLQSISLDVYLKGSSIGTITNFSSIVLPANNQISLDLDVKLNSFGFLSLASNILSDVTSAFKNIAIDIIGTINVDGISLPVNEKYIIN